MFEISNNILKILKNSSKRMSHFKIQLANPVNFNRGLVYKARCLYKQHYISVPLSDPQLSWLNMSYFHRGDHTNFHQMQSRHHKPYCEFIRWFSRIFCNNEYIGIRIFLAYLFLCSVNNIHFYRKSLQILSSKIGEII